jgi:hypothetical protein
MLSRFTTLAEFKNGYWYALELKAFAMEIGVPHATKLRKLELEAAIREFLRVGKVDGSRRNVNTEGVKDVERGLSLKLRVRVYHNDIETKEFLARESRRLSPKHKQRSGSRYRLNR